MDKSVFVAGIADNYDERLLEGRLTAEGNVCGCILKNLELYDESGLEPTDFITTHGRLLFAIAKQLREKGFTICDEISYLSTVADKIKNIVEDTFGGYKQINNVIQTVSINNWDAFLDKLNKMNTLMNLRQKGFNVFDNIILDNGKEVVPFDYFEQLTCQEVLEFYDGTIASMQARTHSAEIVEEGYIDFDEAWIQRVRNKEEMGVSYGEAGYDINGEEIKTFPFMSANTLGLKPGTLSGWAAHSGSGKTTYMVTTAMSLASKGEKVVMVTNESDLSDLKTLFLIWVLYRVFNYGKMTKRRFLSGEFDKEDEDMLLRARKYWREHYAKAIKIEVLPDANASVSCQLIKKAILREGYSAFIVDTMKMTTEDAGDSVWVSLVKDVRALTEIALKYKVIGLITVQLSLGTQNRAWLDSSCLANCKQIKETLSNLILFRKLYGPELDPESPFFIHPFRRKMKDDGSGEWYDEPYDADPEKTWIVAFSDKTRRGIDSGVDGTAFLCRTDLDHASFYETARCRPTRKMFSVEDRRG